MPTPTLFQLDLNHHEFPDPNLALTEPDGLLAIGGDLTPARLKKAYLNGIFPWYSDGEPLMWWSPSERAIIETGQLHISRSLRKFSRKYPFSVSVNCAFSDVVEQCALQRINQEGTWITESMKHAYYELHQLGYAHSVEIKLDNQLVGGLYGVMVGNVFCGESMFHTMTNASKLAMWALHQWLQKNQVPFIDCQMENPHLMSLGAKIIPRQQYLAKLKEANQSEFDRSMWHAQPLVEIYV